MFVLNEREGGAEEMVLTPDPDVIDWWDWIYSPAIGWLYLDGRPDGCENQPTRLANQTTTGVKGDLACSYGM